jgi:adenosylcobyric acid synthase
MDRSKTLRRVAGSLADGAAFEGYEIHLGVTTGAGLERPFLRFADGTPGGAVSTDGRIAGGYVHGLFDRGEARAALLATLGARSMGADHKTEVDRKLDEIAALLHQCLDITALMRIAGL